MIPGELVSALQNFGRASANWGATQASGSIIDQARAHSNLLAAHFELQRAIVKAITPREAQ